MAQADKTTAAFDALRGLILGGVLPPGSDHLEAELATRLGLSRTPVREACRLLEAQGLVQVRPRRGVRVAALSLVDIAEIYEVLTELESLAARRAASAGYSAGDLVTLATAIDRMEAALACGDRLAWAAADDQFHAELLRLGGNGRACAMAAQMADQSARARALTLDLRPLPVRSNEDHRRVYDAILRGDADIAALEHHAHRKRAGAMLIGLLGQI